MSAIFSNFVILCMSFTIPRAWCVSKRRAKQTDCFMAGKWKFRLMKIVVSLALRQRGRPLPASPKGRRAWRSGMAEGGVDLGDLRGEERAALQPCERR